VYDSIDRRGQRPDDPHQRIEAFLNEHPYLSTKHWLLVQTPNYPQQTNGYDCGVFTCAAALAIITCKAMQFQQEDMPAFRSHLALHLIQDSTTKNHIEELYRTTQEGERRGGRGRDGTLGRGTQGTTSLALVRRPENSGSKTKLLPILTPDTPSTQRSFSPARQTPSSSHVQQGTTQGQPDATNIQSSDNTAYLPSRNHSRAAQEGERGKGWGRGGNRGRAPTCPSYRSTWCSGPPPAKPHLHHTITTTPT